MLNMNTNYINLTTPPNICMWPSDFKCLCQHVTVKTSVFVYIVVKSLSQPRFIAQTAIERRYCNWCLPDTDTHRNTVRCLPGTLLCNLSGYLFVVWTDGDGFTASLSHHNTSLLVDMLNDKVLSPSPHVSISTRISPNTRSNRINFSSVILLTLL